MAFDQDWCLKNYLTVKQKKKSLLCSTRFGYPVELSGEGEFWLSDFNEKNEIKLNFFIEHR